MERARSAPWPIRGNITRSFLNNLALCYNKRAIYQDGGKPNVVARTSLSRLPLSCSIIWSQTGEAEPSHPTIGEIAYTFHPSARNCCQLCCAIVSSASG